MIISQEQISNLAEKYLVPPTDVMLIALNCSGIQGAGMENDRVRFKLKPDETTDEFFMALCVDTSPTSFSIMGNELLLNGQRVGQAINLENDTCTESYFRRQGTSLTLNSNSRSQCVGCKFCGTYNLSSDDKKSLTNETYLREYLETIKSKRRLPDFSSLEEVAVCTGCFKSETDLVAHLLLLRKVLSDLNFRGEIKYIGSQLVSKGQIKLLRDNIEKFAIYFTVECFTRREEMLRSEKRISREEIKSILTLAKSLGIETSIVYILGLDSLKEFSLGMRYFKDSLTRFPILNVIQNYIPEHENLKVAGADELDYYLEARRIVEEIYHNTPLRPQLWEGYRNLWFTAYGGSPLEGIKI